jgi:hypothetical protein
MTTLYGINIHYKSEFHKKFQSYQEYTIITNMKFLSKVLHKTDSTCISSLKARDPPLVQRHLPYLAPV